MSASCRVPSDWNFSSCLRVMVMTWASPMASSVLKPVPQFEISRPKVAESRTVLPLQVFWTNCAHVKDGVAVTFELTFLKRYWSMVAMGRPHQPIPDPSLRSLAISMIGTNRVSRWLVAAAILAAVDCAGVIAIEVAVTSPAQAQFRDDRFPFQRPSRQGGAWFGGGGGGFFGGGSRQPWDNSYEQPVDNS